MTISEVITGYRRSREEGEMIDIIICSVFMVAISAGVLFLTWILRKFVKAGGMPDMESEHTQADLPDS